MQGKATFRGHPLHLMVVSFPVAAWTGAAVTDLVGLRGTDPFWFRMSVVLVAAGVATGTLAAVFGYVDYLTIPMSRRAKRVATLHLATSLATLAVYAVALVVRLGGDASPLGIALGYLGVAILFAGGFYGSELVSRFHVGASDRIER